MRRAAVSSRNVTIYISSDYIVRQRIMYFIIASTSTTMNNNNLFLDINKQVTATFWHKHPVRYTLLSSKHEERDFYLTTNYFVLYNVQKKQFTETNSCAVHLRVLVAKFEPLWEPIRILLFIFLYKLTSFIFTHLNISGLDVRCFLHQVK